MTFGQPVTVEGATTCSKKVRYLSAKQVQDAMHNQRRKTKVKVTYYECLICRGFHLTSAKDRAYRKRLKVRK